MVNWYVKVSEWLLFNAKWAIFQLYHGKNILDQHDLLDFSLKQQSAGAHVIPIGHVQNSFNFFLFTFLASNFDRILFFGFLVKFPAYISSSKDVA